MVVGSHASPNGFNGKKTAIKLAGELVLVIGLIVSDRPCKKCLSPRIVSSLRVAGQPGVRRDRQGDRQQDNGSEHRRFHKLTISTECSNKSKMRRALRYSLCQRWCGQRHFNGPDPRRRVRSPDRTSVGQVFSAGDVLLAIGVLSKNAFWSVSTAMFATICQTFLLLV
jgi:hypothetical protein